MSVCSVIWVAGLLLLSALFFRISQLRARQGLLALCNLAFIATLMPAPAAWAILVVFVVSGYFVARILMARPSKIVLASYLVLLTAAFLVLKQYAFLKILLPAPLFQKTIATAGLSYILFRQIQVVVDASQGQIENFSWWNYANYQGNFFAFTAGPIQRYQEFHRYWTDLSPILPDSEAVLLAFLRLFIGVIKIGLIGYAFLKRFGELSLILGDRLSAGHESHGTRILQLLEMFYCFPLYVYFNFSGYCDMVIAGASLVGLKLPENFARPYLSRNMIDFWTRWHRTLGFWIRDYIFTPLYKATASRWPARAATWAVFGYFSAFFLAGLWHGSTWNYVLYGLLNGAGLAATKAWENYLVKTRGRAGLRAYLQNPAIRVAAIVVTLNFACLTMLVFGCDPGQLAHIITNAFGPTLP